MAAFAAGGGRRPPRASGRPDARDAEALLEVAREPPVGSVRTTSIFCRAPNPHPLGASGVNAVPLDAPGALAG